MAARNAVRAGVVAAAALAAFYALVVGFAGGLEHLGQQTVEDWPWLVLIVGGFGTQIGLFYERLTCDEHFELFGRAYRMSQQAVRRARRERYAALGFERYAATRADQLSGGTLAKLDPGLALLADPEVLLLDEPYAGFDWDTYLRFWELVAQRREQGRSVLIISHFVADEERFDRIVHLSDGQTR